MQLELYFAIDQSFLLHHFPLLHLIRFSEKHGRLELADCLTDLMSTPPTRAILVHKTC